MPKVFCKCTLASVHFAGAFVSFKNHWPHSALLPENGEQALYSSPLLHRSGKAWIMNPSEFHNQVTRPLLKWKLKRERRKGRKKIETEKVKLCFLKYTAKRT